MRIAQIAPLYESVPPRLYGGTERVVSTLTEGLVKRGHDVTLFASGDSRTAAKLVPIAPKGLRLAGVRDPLAEHILELAMAYDQAEEFDIIHSHVDYFAFPFASKRATPTVTTLHGRLDQRELQGVHRYYESQPLISISDSQRAPLPFANWAGTIYHGLSLEQFRFSPYPGKYLAFLGRIAPEKGPDVAIQIAKKTGIPLKIAAKISDQDRKYFEAVVKPMIEPPLIEFIGEINEQEKTEFLADALALLFPIDWPEPFGLVMIESLACGTPVIARPCGAVSEILIQGVTGFIYPEFQQLVEAVGRAPYISRERCRRHVETHFSANEMVSRYERTYLQLTGSHEKSSSDALAEAA